MIFVGDWLPREKVEAHGVFPETGGLRVGNLECAFADGEIGSGKAYTSVLPCACLGNVESGGFAALSLANNHVFDAGEGNFSRVARDGGPGRLAFGTVERPYAELEECGRTILVIGCLEPCRSRGAAIFRQEEVEALVRKLRAERPGAVVFVYPHWGMEGEYTRYPSPAQRALARRWIDAGADGVFGSHSHVPQGRETYRGRPIYYSLGNFDFDHPESRLYPGTKDRMMVEAVWGGEGGVRFREHFSSEAVREAVERASAALEGWNTWKWARAVGPFNLRKNTASWKIRLRRSFLRTFPKFLVWQFLPKTFLFRLAALTGGGPVA